MFYFYKESRLCQVSFITFAKRDCHIPPEPPTREIWAAQFSGSISAEQPGLDKLVISGLQRQDSAGFEFET